MTTIDIHHDAATGDVDVQAVADPALEAVEEAKKVMAKARYDAFSLVTEARKEAESILDEARQEASDIIHEAELQAESIVDAARLRSKEDGTFEMDDGPSRKELEAERDELTEEVSKLRALSTELERRFDALTAQAEAPVAPVEPTQDVHAPSPAPVLDYSPSVAPQPKKAEDELEEIPLSEKGSFYNRRSAKLPRIGEEGGRSALDMMRTIRDSFDEG